MPKNTTQQVTAETNLHDRTDFPFGANAPEEPTTDREPGQDPDPDTNQETDAASVPDADPFNVEALRLSADSLADIGLKKAVLTVPCRRPDRTWFVRVHPDPAYRLQTAVIELKSDREVYLVAPHLRPSLAAESTLVSRALFTAINRQQVIFLWLVKLPGSDGRIDEWSRSDLEATQLATRSWVRVQSNLALGAYEVHVATGDIPEPTWPDLPFKQLLKTAFKDRYIDNPDHPVLRRLRGEI
jgi:hypothetical protein